MTALWTDRTAQAATVGKTTSGETTGAFAATNVVIDSRAAGPGDLFIAIRGENNDGHAFVESAAANGAAAAMVAKDWDVPSGLTLPLVRVDDTMAGLTALAKAARARSSAKIIAVTGSVGKTGTKEALAHILAGAGKTHATVGNLNNHYGLPLTLARLPADADYGVFEIGMNHAGEIEPLSELLQPHIAVITTVAAVHLEFFSSILAIADAKAEIFAGLVKSHAAGHAEPFSASANKAQTQGVAILPRDNPLFHHLRARAEDRGVRQFLSFGAHPDASFHLVGAKPSNGGSTVTCRHDETLLSFKTGMPGQHNAINSMAVLAVLHAAGLAPRDLAHRFADLSPPAGRGMQSEVSIRDGVAIRLIDESYNASPTSVEAALNVLGSVPARAGAHRVAVLGDMLELGPEAAMLHANLAKTIANLPIDRVHTCGPMMAHLHKALPPPLRGSHAENSAALRAAVIDALSDGDVVTVKGSLGSKMKLIVDAISAGNSTVAR